MPELDLKEIERRPQRYWNADGIADLTMGALWVVWGTALGLPAALPSGQWQTYYWMAMPLVLVGGAAATNWITKRLKQRFTFPRTGYVQWPRPGVGATLLPALIAVAVAAALAFLAIKGRTETLSELAAPATSLLLSLAFLFASLRLKLPHHLWLAASALILALLIYGLHLSLESGMVCLFLGVGVVSMAVGGLRLRAYLKHNPAPAEGHE
jgi:hypothetical protein